MNLLSTSVSSKRAALAMACGVGLSMMLPVHAAGQGAESWREFARRSMMPDYSWNNAPSAQSLAPTLRGVALQAHGRAFTVSLSDARDAVHRSLVVSFDGVSGAAGRMKSVDSPDFQARLSPLDSHFFGTTYQQDAGAHGRFSVSALMAQQQFATPGFGFVPAGRETASHGTRGEYLRPGETATGQGVRMDYRLPVGDRFAWSWSAQSKLDMDAFESLHGIYGEPGDFDLPARLGVQLEWLTGGTASFALGLERIYFGDITPFTSNTLPQRLLSLMADGTAPTFTWRDLTVYSAEGRVTDRWQGQWVLRYTTRQQPEAAFDLYRRALESEYADSNLSLGYRRGLNGWGEMAFTASYASSMAFLGPWPVFSPETYSRGAVAEFEALWIVPF